MADEYLIQSVRGNAISIQHDGRTFRKHDERISTTNGLKTMYMRCTTANCNGKLKLVIQPELGGVFDENKLDIVTCKFVDGSHAPICLFDGDKIAIREAKLDLQTNINRRFASNDFMPGQRIMREEYEKTQQRLI